MKNLPGKRRTREHIIADLSVNYVERQALLCGYTIERMTQDYGIDLELTTFNKIGEMQAGTMMLQLKASDRLRLRLGQATFPFRIERADLVLWLATAYANVPDCLRRSKKSCLLALHPKLFQRT